MSVRRSQLVVAGLVALLVAAPLVANLCHHHAGSSDTNCPICHFNHQPMDRPVAGQRMPTIDVIRDGPALMEMRVLAAQALAPLASRAPPSA
jgi:hypothetical protein